MVKVKRRGSQAGGTQPSSQGPSQRQSGPLPDAEKFAFLQAIMQEKFMSEEQAKELFKKLVSMCKKGASYTETVAELNDGLAFLFMELRSVRFPVDGKKYIGLVNKENDDVAKNNGSSFSIPQIQYLRAVIEQIALDPDASEGVGSLSSLETSNVDFSSDFMTQQASQGTQSGAKRLNMAEKDAAIKQFVKEGWLVNTPDKRGRFSLGVRTFLELHEMLLEFDLPAATRTHWEQTF